MFSVIVDRMSVTEPPDFHTLVMLFVHSANPRGSFQCQASTVLSPYNRYPPQNLDHRSSTAAAMTGNTLTSSPKPANSGGILALTNAPAASRTANRL